MGTRQEHTQKVICDRQLDLHSGYLIYFDNVCMNEFVKNYVTNVGISVGMGSATVTLIYAPQFKSIDTIDDNGGFKSSEDGIQNGTNLRIFVENPFSNKYEIIFDGIIKGRHFMRSPSGFGLSFSSTDYMYWLNRTVIPVTIPYGQKVSSGERIRWKGQGIDVDQIDSVNIVSRGSLTGKTIKEYWYDTLKDSLLKNSTVFSDPNTVAVFDNAIDRIELMGDINDELVRQQVIDLVITANATFADTAYVSLNNVAGNLSMEFYQDKDGVIRLKPPFWNEPVLKSHIIDPIMIKSGFENTNWNNLYTRIIAQGGVAEWENSTIGTTKPDLITPIGVYVGNLGNKAKGQWADYLNYPEDFVTFGGESSTEGAVNGVVGNSQAEITVYNFLTTEMGLNRAAACGIMANINRESTFNAGAVGDSQTSYGICQWHNTRLEAPDRPEIHERSLIGWCKKNGYNYKDLTSQLKYLKWDVSSEGGYPLKSLGITPTINAEQAAEQAEYFCRDYEVPAEMEREVLVRRELAKKYFENFNHSDTQSSAPTGSSLYPISECKAFTKKSSSFINENMNFKASEFDCRCSNCNKTYISEGLVQILDLIKAFFGDSPITINSGYRCAKHNDDVDGADSSLHLSGAAADIVVQGYTSSQVYNGIINNLDRFVYGTSKIGGLIKYDSFVHVDVRRGSTYFSSNSGADK